MKLAEDSPVLSELNRLCEKKAAYRLGVDGFIGYKYLWDLILNSIKMENDIDNLMVDNHFISPNIVFKILNSLESDGLIRKENSHYRAVLDKLLSKEVILGFCWGRADKIWIKDILNHFHFKSTCLPGGGKMPSAAFYHCQQTIDNLCSEGLLKKSTNDDSLLWADI